MSESMKDYEAEINASFRKIGVGDIVTGTVIAVTEDEVTLDLRYFRVFDTLPPQKSL